MKRNEENSKGSNGSGCGSSKDPFLGNKYGWYRTNQSRCADKGSKQTKPLSKAWGQPNLGMELELDQVVKMLQVGVMVVVIEVDVDGGEQANYKQLEAGSKNNDKEMGENLKILTEKR